MTYFTHCCVVCVLFVQDLYSNPQFVVRGARRHDLNQGLLGMESLYSHGLDHGLLDFDFIVDVPWNGFIVD